METDRGKKRDAESIEMKKHEGSTGGDLRWWKIRRRPAAGGRSALQSYVLRKGPRVNNVTVHLLPRQHVNHTCTHSGA